MLNYAISFAAALLCAGMAYLAMTKCLADKIKIFNILGSGEDHESRDVKKAEKAAAVIAAAALSFAASYRLLTGEATTDTVIRVFLLFLPITAAGCIDSREKRIPNIISLFLFVEGVVFLGVEFFINRDLFESYAVSCLLSFGATFIVLALVGLVTGKGIGAGDIKLLSTLGLVGGVYLLCGTVVVATVVCAVVALTLLVTKKKSLKSSLPYGPFIAVGFFVTVIFNLY